MTSLTAIYCIFPGEAATTAASITPASFEEEHRGPRLCHNQLDLRLSHLPLLGRALADRRADSSDCSDCSGCSTLTLAMGNDTRREPISTDSWEQGRPRTKASLSTGTARLGAIPRFLFLAYISTALLYTLYYTIAEPLLRPSVADHGAAYDPVKEALELAGKVEQDAGEQIWGGSEGHQPHQHGEVVAATTAGSRGSAQPSTIASNKAVSWREYGRIHGVEWGVDTVSWNPAQASDKLSMSMAEDFFLSKAFGESLQPSKVIPYYYRATSHFGAKDITITTLVTSNRFKVLAALSETYQGSLR